MPPVNPVQTTEDMVKELQSFIGAGLARLGNPIDLLNGVEVGVEAIRNRVHADPSLPPIIGRLCDVLQGVVALGVAMVQVVNDVKSEHANASVQPADPASVDSGATVPA